jgi:hypothetical protein
MATISGTVSLSTGTSFDAFITVYSNATGSALAASTYSNAVTGAYSVSVPAGDTYTVKASKYGYLFADQTPVTPPATVNLTGTFVTVSLGNSISGVVDNAPAGLLIVCHPATNLAVVSGAQFTNGVGAFSFTGLSAGNYTIVAEPATSVSQPAGITVPAGSVISAGTWTYVP